MSGVGYKELKSGPSLGQVFCIYPFAHGRYSSAVSVLFKGNKADWLKAMGHVNVGIIFLCVGNRNAMVIDWLYNYNTQSILIGYSTLSLKYCKIILVDVGK